MMVEVVHMPKTQSIEKCPLEILAPVTREKQHQRLHWHFLHKSNQCLQVNGEEHVLIKNHVAVILHSTFFDCLNFEINTRNCASWTSLMRLVVQQAIDDVKGWGRPKVMDDFSWAWQTWNLSTVISSHPRRSFWNKFMLRLGRAYFQQKQDWRPNHYPFHYELESSVPNFV